MLKLLSQLNHGESKLNSELQIINWKKKSSIMEAVHLGNFARVAKFPNPYEIL